MTENVTQLPVPIWAADVAATEDFGEPGSILIHAEPGRGKSRAALTIAKVRGFERVAVLDIDNGTEVLLNDPELRQKYAQGLITIIKIDKTKPDAFVKFHNYFWDIINNGKAYGFNAFIIDTADVAQEVAAEWYLANTMNDSGTALDSRAAWGKVSEWTSKMLWALQNHPTMLGITVNHTKVDEKEAKKTGVSTLKPKYAGSVKDTAAGIPSIVIYMTKETTEDGRTNIIADMGGDAGAISKQRYSSFLPNRLENFSMPLLYGLIRGEITLDASPAIPTIQTDIAAAAAQTQPTALAATA
ncbi:AAA family ATPase [Microbacterium sp. T32]|uniref:AAA family ATPase n=1 Tax=Microbacterium sp. T32 TaxID=1776083 RepID=UPI0007AB4A62|nr:AAA family ATPase [Microbacterium sp. T32]KZE41414.1 hypothetical protein AVW09_02160 [Microbacterium sp. T32]